MTKNTSEFLQGLTLAVIPTADTTRCGCTNIRLEHTADNSSSVELTLQIWGKDVHKVYNEIHNYLYKN